MEYRRLGNSGLKVSVVGLGCNNFGGMIAALDLAASRAVIDAAIDSGITLFDTADSYGANGGSEKVLGEVLGNRRHDIVLATKFASPMNRAKSTRYEASRRYIMQAVEASLTRLNTDYIDLYQYHFPDPDTPREETLRALDDLVRQGKVRYIGVSNMPAWQLVDAAWISRTNGLPALWSRIARAGCGLRAGWAIVCEPELRRGKVHAAGNGCKAGVIPGIADARLITDQLVGQVHFANFGKSQRCTNIGPRLNIPKR